MKKSPAVALPNVLTKMTMSHKDRATKFFMCRLPNLTASEPRYVLSDCVPSLLTP